MTARRRGTRIIGARGGIPNPEEVGQRIKAARQAMGLSQLEFGAKLDFGRKAIVHYEHGRYLTRLALQQIAAMTREPLEWFLTGRRPGLEAIALSNDPEIKAIARQLLPLFRESKRRETRAEVVDVLRLVGAALVRALDEIDAEK